MMDSRTRSKTPSPTFHPNSNLPTSKSGVSASTLDSMIERSMEKKKQGQPSKYELAFNPTETIRLTSGLHPKPPSWFATTDRNRWTSMPLPIAALKHSLLKRRNDDTTIISASIVAKMITVPGNVRRKPVSGPRIQATLLGERPRSGINGSTTSNSGS